MADTGCDCKKCTDTAFARSMLRLRLRRRWSQTTLAAEAGVSSAGVIGRIEFHGAGCTLHTARRIAKALETTVDAMFTEADLRAAAEEAAPVLKGERCRR